MYQGTDSETGARPCEATGPAALLDCAIAYANQEHGYLLWRERPEPLRRGIVARIPPAGWLTEDGRHPR